MSLQIKFANPPKAEGRAFIRLIGGGFAIVDSDLFDELSRSAWRAVKSQKCTYAVRRETKNGSVCTVRMHRLIAGTPTGKVCHHINHNPLDNRLKNLLNLYPTEHDSYHGHG